MFEPDHQVSVEKRLDILLDALSQFATLRASEVAIHDNAERMCHVLSIGAPRVIFAQHNGRMRRLLPFHHENPAVAGQLLVRLDVFSQDSIGRLQHAPVVHLHLHLVEAD